MKTKTIFLAAAVCFFAGCEDGGNPTTGEPLPKTVSLCRTSMPVPELVDMLDGDLAIVAGFSRDGWGTSEIVGGFIEGFVINTLDFHALEKWNAAFSGGVYRVHNGSNTLDLILILDEDFGSFKAGDTLKENIFDPAAYVRNVSLNLSGVSFDHGPLYGFISGGIGWKGTTPTVHVDATRLSLRVVSTGYWYFTSLSGGEIDTIKARMASTLLNLGNFKRDFRSGTMGFTYDSTFYTSPSRKLGQSIYQSLFLMKPLDAGAKSWSWEGGYRSRLDKASSLAGTPLRIFINGHVSTVNGNSGGYYCDEGLQDSIGVAVEDTSGWWGYFKSVRGDSIPYGLVPAQK